MGSRLHFQRMKEGPPLPHHDDIRAYKREYAAALDERDPLKSYRDQFIIPSKKDLLRKRLADTEGLYTIFEPLMKAHRRMLTCSDE